MASGGAFSGLARVPRGTAPAGTFNIPDEGFTVPKNLSFLERFRNKEIAEPSRDIPATEYASRAENPSLPHTDAEMRINVLASAVSDLTTEETAHNDDSNSKKLEVPVKNETTVAADDKTIQSEPKFETSREMHEDNNLPETNEVNDNDEFASLCFPALRLCASSALVDRAQLEGLVSLPHLTATTSFLLFHNFHFLADKSGIMFYSPISPPQGLPLGFVWSPFGDLVGVSTVSRDPQRCGTCGSFLAKGNGAGPVLGGASTWICAFCARSDNAVAQGVSEASPAVGDTRPELKADVVEYASKTPHIPAAPHRQAIVVLLDERLRISEAEWARTAVRAMYECAAQNGKMFALITYGVGVCVADFSDQLKSAPVALDVLSAQRASQLDPTEKSKYFCDPPPKTNGPPRDPEQILAIVQRCVTASIDLGAGDADNDVEQLPVSSRRDEDLEEDIEPRRLDAALAVALELISGVADTENSRIITLMTGSPTLEEPDAPGVNGEADRREPSSAADFDVALRTRFETLGSRAGDMRIALDFLCFGSTDDYAANAILGAARRSRGGIVFSGAHGFVSGSELANSARFLAQRSTNPGVVSIRVSSPLAVSRVIGPAFPTAAPHTYAVPGVDPTAGFTVILQPHTSVNNATELPSHVVVQLAAKSSFVTRVITVQIPITKDPDEFLDSVDAEVSAVVLGKACIVSNGGLTQPIVAARAVDLSVKALLQADLKCVSVARLLFELRRGFMLERHGNSDSALIQRALFLRLEGTLASLLLSPRLFTNAIADEDTGLMAEVPLDVASVRDDAVMVLDAGFNIFLLVGAKSEDTAEDAVTKSAQKVAKQRSFPCQLWRLKQGEDSAKLIESYLVAEPVKQPRLRLPRLRSVKTVNEMTFYGYCKMLAPGAATVRLMAETV